MSRQRRVNYETVDFGGQRLVPVQYTADAMITLRKPKDARRLHRAGTVDIISADGWRHIESTQGSGLNVEVGYL